MSYTQVFFQRSKVIGLGLQKDYYTNSPTCGYQEFTLPQTQTYTNSPTYGYQEFTLPQNQTYTNSPTYGYQEFTLPMPRNTTGTLFLASCFNNYGC